MKIPRHNGSGRTAFTLIEVMVAMGIFFMAIFAILEVVASNLRAAKHLQKPQVDASLVISDLYQTNRLFEETKRGDFGELYPGWEWETTVTRDNTTHTNGYFRVDVVIIGPDHRREDAMSVDLWRPASPASGAGLR